MGSYLAISNAVVHRDESTGVKSLTLVGGKLPQLFPPGVKSILSGVERGANVYQETEAGQFTRRCSIGESVERTNAK